MTERTTPSRTGSRISHELVIEGYCDPSFAEVGHEFERNFSERGDLGASVCVIVGGEEVVNLWGGATRAGILAARR
jgi:hypothetical protein